MENQVAKNEKKIGSFHFESLFFKSWKLTFPHRKTK